MSSRNETLTILLNALFALRPAASTAAEVRAQVVADGGTLTPVEVAEGLAAGGRRGLFKTACRALADPEPAGPFSEMTYQYFRGAIARNPRNAAYADASVIRTPGNSAYPTASGPFGTNCAAAKGSPNGSGYACCGEPAFPI